MLNCCQRLHLSLVSDLNGLEVGILLGITAGEKWKLMKNSEEKKQKSLTTSDTSIVATGTTDITSTSAATTKFGSANADILGVRFNVETNEIVVEYREQSMVTLGNGNPMPDRIWKETYSVDEVGQLFLKSVKNGTHSPGYYVNEEFDFDD